MYCHVTIFFKMLYLKLKMNLLTLKHCRDGVGSTKAIIRWIISFVFRRLMKVLLKSKTLLLFLLKSVGKEI